MASTVQPDRKLMPDTLKTPVASNTGLIITPPPMPQIAPTIEDPMLTRKNRTVTIMNFPQLRF